MRSGDKFLQCVEFTFIFLQWGEVVWFSVRMIFDEGIWLLEAMRVWVLPHFKAETRLYKHKYALMKKGPVKKKGYDTEIRNI